MKIKKRDMRVTIGYVVCIAATAASGLLGLVGVAWTNAASEPNAAPEPSAYSLVSGKLEASENDLAEGYFYVSGSLAGTTINPATTSLVKVPRKSIAYLRLSEALGQSVTIILQVDRAQE